jgi:hypothetical protein
MERKEKVKKRGKKEKEIEGKNLWDKRKAEALRFQVFKAHLRPDSRRYRRKNLSFSLRP